MAHKKAGGSTKNGRDSESKRLGLKKFGGEHVVAGNILVRQRGTQYRAGENVGVGTDHTLFALADRHRAVQAQGRRPARARQRRARRAELAPAVDCEKPRLPGAFAFPEQPVSRPAATRQASCHEIRRRSHDQGPGRQRRARLVSFRREKFIPFGGPGRRRRRRRRQHLPAAPSRGSTRSRTFAISARFKAKNGEPGGSADCTAAAARIWRSACRSAPSSTTSTPRRRSATWHAGDRVLVARGGKGGRGNPHFKSSTNRAPRQSTPGDPGEKRELQPRAQAASPTWACSACRTPASRR